MRQVFYMPRYAAMALIRLYQKTLSFDHGWGRLLYPNGFCQFHPTCSEYGYQCMERHGIIHGSTLTLWRILRCNPFAKGGVDEVPEKK